LCRHCDIDDLGFAGAEIEIDSCRRFKVLARTRSPAPQLDLVGRLDILLVSQPGALEIMVRLINSGAPSIPLPHHHPQAQFSACQGGSD
jgi:hypothetical protein